MRKVRGSFSRALFSPPLRSPLETLRHHNNRVTRALPRAAQERDLWPDLLLERPVVARRCSLLAEFDWLLLVFSRGSSCIQSQVRLNGCDQNIKSRVIYEETLRNTDQRMVFFEVIIEYFCFKKRFLFLALKSRYTIKEIAFLASLDDPV